MILFYTFQSERTRWEFLKFCLLGDPFMNWKGEAPNSNFTMRMVKIHRRIENINLFLPWYVKTYVVQNLIDYF